MAEQVTGTQLIADERERQMLEEGWTPDHDDTHHDDSLALAAACYTMPPWTIARDPDVPKGWPWEPEAWKPRDRVTDLVRAGALIAAEIDRLHRSGGSA